MPNDFEDETYQVAVTVFATVRRRAVHDQRAIDGRVVDAIEQALHAANTNTNPSGKPVLQAAHVSLPAVYVYVHEVLATDMAARSGYLTLHLSALAFPPKSTEPK
jgi:hypothetical protein